MKFHNPSTDEVLVFAMPGIGTFIAGPLYLLFSKLWLAAGLWLATYVVLLMWSDNVLLSALISNAAFAFLTPMFVRRRYEAVGWLVVSDADPIEPKLRDCPRCKEKILAAATKCKHCGSDVQPIPTLADLYLPSQPVSQTPPSNLTVTDHIERIMKAHGITQTAVGYNYEGQDYPSFADVVTAVNKNVAAAK